MPALVPAVGAAVAFFSTPIGSLVLLGVISGISALTRPKAETTAQSASGAQLSLQRGEDTVLDAVVGRCATGGQLAFHYETGDDNDFLNLAIILGTGLHDSLEAMLVGGEAVALAGSNSDTYGRHVTTEKYLDADGNPLIWVKFFNGSMSQAADANMVSEVADADRWGTSHKLTGHAWVRVRVKYDEDAFGGSEPQFLFQVKGLRLYDWRKDSTVAGGSGSHRWDDPSTFEWTENPAVVLYNYRRGVYCGSVRAFGIGTGPFDNDLAKFTAAANLADEVVHYPDTGRNLPRYSVGFVLRDDMDPQEVTTLLEEAMGGYGASSGGVYGPLPAAVGSPVMTITDADLQLGYPHTMQTKLDPASSWTCVQGQYTSPEKGWQLAPYATSKDAAVDTAQGGRRTLAKDFEFVNVYETASQLAEIARRRDLFSKQESGVFRPKFIRLEVGDIVTRVSSLLGTVSMMVHSTKELEDGSVSLALREWDNYIVPDSGDDYVPAAPAEAAPAPAPALLLTVPSFAVTAIDLTDGTASQPAFKATWAAISDQTVDRVVIRYYPEAVGISDAQYVSVPRGSTTSAVLTGLAPATAYVIQAKLETTPSRSGLVYTSPVVRTSGALSAAADVPPITPDMLGVDLAAERGILVGSGPGSLAELIATWQEEMDQLAGAVTTTSMVTNKVRTMLTASFGAASAAILTEQQVRASEDAALAVQITEVLAQVGDVIADGFLRFDSVVDGGGASATITAKVKATAGSNFSQAAWILKATASGLDTTAEFGVVGALKVYNPLDGTLTQALGVDSGVVKFNRLESFANVSGVPIIVVNGDTGYFGVTVA